MGFEKILLEPCVLDDLSMIDCHKCRHYHVTWDARFPHGCRAMKFKSKQLPSAKVYRYSGTECLMYRRKKRSRKQE